MIKEKITNVSECSLINKALYPAFKWLNDLNSEYKEGLYIINGNKIFANIQSYNTKQSNSVFTEYHKKYIDIQYIISGEETIYSGGTATPVEEFNTEDDIGFVATADDSSIHLTAGEFLIIFPGELHKPCCMSEKSCPVKKAVVKVDINALKNNC